MNGFPKEPVFEAGMSPIYYYTQRDEAFEFDRLIALAARCGQATTP